MFQSTQNLMLRPTAFLGHPKIHPPLPLTRRESAQLLNLLTTSFRQQLDREHGSFQSSSDSSKTPPSFSSSRYTPSNCRPYQSKPDAKMPTDRHLHSILTNPLFTGVKKDPDALRDPMDIFDEACAKGFMKIEYATKCLKAKKWKIEQSFGLDVRDAMKSSGAGSQVLRWMFSSGIANDLSFLQDKEFSNILIEFLVAERLQSLIWTWIEKVIPKINSAIAEPATPFHHNEIARTLLYTFIKAEAFGYVSLDTAIASLGRARKSFPPGCGAPYVLRAAGRHIHRRILLGAKSRSAPSPEMFDYFLSIVPDFTSFAKYHQAHLLLHHPTKPDASLALESLKEIKMAISASSDPRIQQPALGTQYYPQWRVISLGLNTARHLLEGEQYSKARWVMNFLRENYENELGISKTIKQAQAEASSLELLEGLSVA
jgi:hypothetical protein